MALKDWKKLEDWEKRKFNIWRKGESVVEIVRTYDKTGWNVAIFPHGIMKGYTKLECCDTRPEALKFAKDYMKKH